jgi:methionyl-tRNA formyltransferase
VVSQPDRPAGRGLRVLAPPVVLRARELGVETYQPVRVRNGELRAWLAERAPEVAVVAAYGRILPVDVLAVPRKGCINLHASLLPAYRGAAPIQWALLAGERETGISLMLMDAGMDTGPVYRHDALSIPPEMNAGQLTQALAELGAHVLRQHLHDVVEGRLQAAPQDENRASHAPPLAPEQASVDWKAPATHIANQVRAFAPKPGAHTRAGGKRLKLLEARVTDAAGAAGEVLSLSAQGIVVACGERALSIASAQLEGRTVQSARELINGRALHVGQQLG